MLHQKLYRARENEMASITDSTVWLRHGAHRARDEAALFFVQDRNIFLGVEAQCPHCGVAKRTVDHMATHYECTARHNEVVRCIHLAMCNRYNLVRRKRLRTHSVQETISGEEATIVVDTRVRTDVKVKHDRPDYTTRSAKRSF